jgi:hypothetical protein
MPSLTKRAKGPENAQRDFGPSGRKRQPRKAYHGVAAPIAEPGIAGDNGLAVGSVCNGPGKQERIGREREPGKPGGRATHRRTAGECSGYDRTVVIETAEQRGREVRRWLGFDARNYSAPFSGNERQRRFAHAEMVVGRVESPLGVHCEIEIAVPITLARNAAAGRPNIQ